MTNGKKMKKANLVFSRENIAIIVSLIALVLSYLGYRQSLSSPRLFTTGKVTVNSGDDGENKFLCKITVHNLGNKVATDVAVSIGTLSSKGAEVILSPPRIFTKKVESGVLYIRFDSLGAGDELSILLEDDVTEKQTVIGHSLVGPPYFVHSSCKEGSDHSTFIGMGESKKDG